MKLFILFITLPCFFLRANASTDLEAHKENDSKEVGVEFFDSVTRNYMEKAIRAQMLRNELQEQFNLMSHFSSTNDKPIFFIILSRARKTYSDLNEILDSFLPSMSIALEVVNSFKSVIGHSMELESEANSGSSEHIRSKKRYSWLNGKRNQMMYNMNRMPVIRTGK
jgi:hypothetical protein